MNARRHVRESRSGRWPATATELMTANPKSVNQHATIQATADALRERCLHVAPVIDDAGRPVGVVSRTDLLEFGIGVCGQTKSPATRGINSTPHLAATSAHDPRVREIMATHVFSVPMDTPLLSVARTFSNRKVKSLFVTDGSGVLVGTIDVNDVLRALIERQPTPLRDKASEAGDPVNRRNGSCSLSSAIPP
jgi:CBS domain-containing membrane protein